ncbi:MAG: RsmG family class I SAM-dependent methyltransferase [Alphaproteobacteria bacterium]
MPYNDALQHYYRLLKIWNDKINLIAPQQLVSFDYFHHHHLKDCLWLAVSIKKNLPNLSNNFSLIDLGSGNGLPAIPLAMVFQNPVVMIEKINKKGVFLKTILAELNLSGQVITKPIETGLKNAIIAHQPKFLTARALLPLKHLLPLLSPIIPNHLSIYLLKSKNFQIEWQATSQHDRRGWQITKIDENNTGKVIIKLDYDNK